MKAFVVHRNGEQLCTAGIGTDGVLSAIVNWVSRGNEGEFHMHVGGLDTSTDEHVRWRVPEIGIGDEITIRIVEADTVDQPVQRFKRSEAPG
jgi:hypothetical protein